MALPSSDGSIRRLENAWQNAQSAAHVLKSRATAINAQSEAGALPSSKIMDLVDLLRDVKATLASVAAVPGIAAYVQARVGGSFDIIAEISALNVQIDATRTWVVDNFPKSSGWLLERSFDVNGVLVDRNFSTASLAEFRTVLDALLATID